ncbi:MAG: hypothetical protein QW478_07125, partial [Candidatus Micrarchaeaceae archaeon]
LADAFPNAVFRKILHYIVYLEILHNTFRYPSCSIIKIVRASISSSSLSKRKKYKGLSREIGREGLGEFRVFD